MTTRSIAVVGGGFGGVSAAVMLHRAGYDNVTVFERAARIGGVWHHNTYPGAACDVPSHLYEFSFAPNPSWSRRYARQAEIQAYVEEVARRYGVLDRIHTNTEVASASWDSSRSRWLITSNHGDHEAHILITACGQLSVPKIPQFKGLDTFRGPAFHTAQWRHDVDLSGKRVAVIGTGCSAIQVVPAIQPYVESVTIYQRSPAWTIPRLDFAYPAYAQRIFARFPTIQRLDRGDIGLHGARRPGHDAQTLAPARLSCRRSTPHQQGDRRSAPPAQGHPSRRIRLQTRNAYRHLVSHFDQAQCRAH